MLEITESIHNNTNTKILTQIMGPEHPCMSFMGRQGMQAPGHSLPRPFIRVMLAENNLGG